MTQRIHIVNHADIERRERKPSTGPARMMFLFLLLLSVLAYAGAAFAGGGAILSTAQDAYKNDQVPVASVTDGSGNVYVTGWSVNGGTDYDWWTRKFNADGSIGWVGVYNSSTGTDQPTAIALDSQNNVIVTGMASVGSSKTIHTIKYRGDTGAKIWERSFTGSSQDLATAVAVDNQDNVYVAGYTQNAQGKHIVVIKYSHSDIPEQDGVQLWKAVHDQDSTNTEEAWSVAADGNGVAVTGFSGTGSDFDLLTVYYGTDGVFKWEQRRNSTTTPPTADQGKYVKLDPAGNVIVTGYLVNSPGNTIYTAKYSRADGAVIWEESYPSIHDNVPGALALDAAGNAYLLATIWTETGNNDLYLVKYGRDPSSGTTSAKLWETVFDSGAGNPDIATSSGLAVDAASGDVYVSGYTESGGVTTFQTIRYKGDTGVELWHAGRVNPANLSDRPVGIGLFPGGDVLVAGWTGTPANGLDYLLVKYQAGGLNRPTGLVAQASAEAPYPISLHWVDNSNNETGFNIYRQDSLNGVWNKVVSTSGTSYTDNAVAADNRYDYYVTAIITSPVDGSLLDESHPSNQAFAVTTVITPMPPAGSSTVDSTDHLYETATSIGVGPDNEPVLTGATMLDIGGYDYLTVKFDTDLNIVWKDIYGDDMNGTDEANVVAVDRANNVVVSGYSELDNGTTGNSSQIFTLKYDGAGNGDQTTSRIWKAQFTGTPRIDDRAEAVATAVDGSNNVVVAGRGRNAAANYDLYVVKYASAPNLDAYGNNLPATNWQAQPFDRGGDDQPTAVAFDASGNIFVAGFTERAAQGTATSGSVGTLEDSAKAWSDNQWVHARLTITSGLNAGETRSITSHTSTALTVDAPFSFPITAGTTYAISDYDWFTAKYNGTTGARIWTDIYDSGYGNDRAYGAAVDPATGDLYVTGYRSNAAGNTDIYTIKYKGSPASAPVAEKLWAENRGLLDGAGHGDDYAVSVKVAPLTRRVIVGGTVQTGAGNSDFALIMYESDGTPVWAPEARIPLMPASDDYAAGLAVDNSESIYLTGTVNKNDGTTDSMTLKYNGDGVLLSTTVFDGAAHLNDESNAIVANSRGDVFVAGSSQPAPGNTDLLVYKIAADPLQAPYPLTASTAYRSVTLSWPDNSSGESGYILQRANGACSSAGTWTDLGPLAADRTSYTDNGLNVGTAYCYRIQSFLGTKGTAGYRESLGITADAVTLTPGAPGSLTITPVNTTQVNLAWTLPALDGYTGFVIERCTGGSCTFTDAEEKVVFPPVSALATTFTDSSVCAGITYRYRITTVNRGLSLDNNGGWTTRKQVTFTSFRPNTYAQVTIPYAAPMKTDFSDLRFYDAVGQQELPYWIERKTDGVSAVIAVKTGVTDKAYLYYGNGSAQPAGNVTGLVAYWPFEEASGTVSGTIADRSGNGFTGSLYYFQAPNGVVAGGKFGNGLSLDGSSDHIRVTDTTSSLLDITGSFTLEAWYQYSASVDWARIISKPTVGSNAPYHMYALLLDNTAGAQKPYIEFGGGTGSPKGPNLAPGNWYHLVGRYNAAAGTASIFVNGVEYGQNVTPVTIGVTDTNLGIGAEGLYGWGPTKGTLDEVRIYNRPLTNAEIVNRYTMVASGLTLGAAEAPPNGDPSFDFTPSSWQSVYVNGASSAAMPQAPAPTLTSASRINEARIDLSWTDNSSDETGFQVERMCTTGTGCADADYAVVPGGSLGASAGTGAKSFSDTGLNPNWTYSYRIRALKSGACGWGGAVSGVKSASTTVNAPVVTSTTSINTTRLDLAWTDDASTLSGYRVERCSGTSAACASGTFATVGGTPAKTYDDIAACENTDYTYRVASLFNGLTASGGPWSYRVQLAIANFQPNFKTRLAIPYNSAMNADFSDIRFFDATEGKELLYWIESKTNGVSAVAWVKTGNNNAVYLYYGNRKATSSSSMAGVFGSGLVGYWQFEEAAGTTTGTTADISGKGNHPTLSSIAAPYGIVAGGMFGNALSLDGGAMNARMDPVTLPTGSVMSVEAWIKPTAYSTATYNGIVSWGNRTTASAIDLCVQNTGRPCVATWGNDFVPGTGAAATSNAWNHIAVVMNGKAVTLYMNGQPVSTTLGILPTITSQGFIIGSTDWTSGRSFKGLIDDVRIYNRTLTPQEIASSYAATLPAATISFAAAEAAPPLPAEWLGPYSAITAQASKKTAAAAAPTGLAVSWKSDSQLDLVWSDTNNDETGFRIERCTDEACCRDALCTDPLRKTVITVNGTQTSYTDGGLTPGATYWYRVRAFKTAACGWDKGGYGANDVKSGTATVKAPENVTVTPALFTSCNDIRFADAAGATVYPYWVKMGCGTTDTFAVVRFPSLAAGQAPLYLYYGNSAAPGASNGAAVSEVFDDFLNLSAWTTAGAVSTSAGILTVDGSATTVASLYRNFTVAGTFAAEVKYQHPSTYRNRLFLTTPGNGGSPTGWDYGVWESINWNYVFSGVTLTPNTWYTLRWENNPANYTFRVINQSGADIFSGSTAAAIANLQSFSMSGAESNVSDFKVDWFSVRKTAIPAPVTLLDPLKNRFPASPYLVDGVTLSGRKEFTVTNSTGSALTDFPVDVRLDTRPLATDRITIGWSDPSAIETGFSIVRCTATDLSSSCDPESAGTWSATAGPNSGPTASYADTSVLPATRYCYKVKTLVDGVTTVYSSVPVCASTQVPLKPSGLAATVTGTRVDLAWTDTSPAVPAGYLIERCKIVSGGTCVFDGSDATFTSFELDHSLKSFTDPDACGGTYRYRVKSVKPWVTGWPAEYDGPVEAAIGVPTAPSGLNALPVTESQITLNWSDNTTDETKILVQRCSLLTCTDNDFATVTNGTLGPNAGTGAMSFVDNTAVPGVTYTYRIVAMKEGSCSWTVVSSELSDPAKTRTVRNVPVLAATPIHSTRIDLSWTDTTAGETGYCIIRCTDAACTSPSTLATLGVGATSYSDTAVCNSTQPYYYQVAGFKSAALSFAGGGTWTKRAKLSITNFQPNFQTKVSITIANFPGMDANLKDVRFYDATAGGELPYWIEGITSGVANVYVRTGANNNIYLYYGNASAAAASNGAATFLLFEDFESGMGRLPNGKAVQVISPVKSGSYAGKLASTGALVEDYLDLGSMIKGKVTVDYYLPQTNLDVVAATLTTSGWGSDQAWAKFKTNGYVWTSSGATENYLNSYGANTWYKLDMNFDTTTDTYTACFNDTCNGTSRAFVTPSTDIRYLRLARPDSAGETIYFDNVRIGAYAATQPTTTLGTPESSAGYVFTSTWSDDNRSAIVPATTLALAKPSLGSVTKMSDSRLDLAWTDTNSDETGFEINRCGDGACSSVIRSVKTTVPASNAATYTDTGLVPSTGYYYRLRAYKTQAPACGGDVLGEWSDISGASTDAPVPTNLSATAYGSNTVNLAWNDTTQGDTGFAVERCEGDPCTTSFTQIGTIGSTTEPYVVRYTFNNTLQDSSGSGLHLTGTTPVYEDGGLRLSTSSSFQSPVTSILDTDYYTIEFDFKMKAVTPNAGTWYPVFHYKPPTTDRSPGIWMENSSRAMFTWQHDNVNYSGLSGLGPNSCNSTSQFAIDSWYHIKGVKNGSTFKIYVNGSPTPVCENSNVAFPKVAGSSPLYFGGAEIVLRNFTITNDTVTRRMFADTTVCSGKSYTYQVKAVGGGLSSSGGGCWKRRAKLQFAPNTFIANHQTRLTLNRTAYPDIQPDFRDIRFYDTASWTEIPYWIEKVSGTTATVWIRTGGNDSIYLYYGNTSASSSADGSSVFEIFDDFEGNSLNPNTWTMTDLTGFSVSNGKLHGTDTTGKIESTTKFGAGMTVEAKASSTKSAVHGQLIAGLRWDYSTWVNGSFEWRNRNNLLWQMNGYSATSGAALPGASPVLYRLKLKTTTTADAEAENYDTGASLASLANVTLQYSGSGPYALALGRALYSDDRQGEPRESYVTDWDWVRVRKYVATEPSVTFGAAEGDGVSCQGIASAWPADKLLLSNQAAVTLPSPAAPAGLNVTVSGAQAALSWVDNTADETGFSIERCAVGAASSCDFSSLDGGFPKTVAANSTSFTDTGLAYQTTYCYRIRSYRGETCGEWQTSYAAPVCARTAAAPPFNLKAEAVNSYKIRLTWEYDSAEEEAGFEVERMMPNGLWTLVGKTGANVTTFTDMAGIEPGKGYRYRVRAFYGSAGGIVPSAWTQRAFIRNVSGVIVTGEDITRELSDVPIEIVDATNGSASVAPASGTVTMATSSTGGGSSTATSTSRVLLKNLVPYAGDFDVQVDYSMPDGQLSSGEWIVHSRLHIAFGSNYATLYRAMNNGSNQYYGVIYSNGTTSSATVPTTDTAGKLRIKRQGDVTTLFVMANGAWREIHTGSCSAQPATSLQLLQEVRRKDTAAIRTVYSNFIGAPYTSPYSDEATVTYTSGGSTIPTTPPYVPGATPCD